MPKISIVTSVYNSSEYLVELLDSCLNQTLSDIEIICVDNCSTDSSHVILETYAKKDARVRLFRHEQNTGSGGGRNTGLRNAQGEYIWFVDSDDVLELDACNVIYETMCANNVPMVYFNNFDFYEQKINEKTVRSIDDFPPNTVIPIKKMNQTSHVEQWHYCAKASVAKQLSYLEKVQYEDTLFFYQVLAKIDSFYYLAKPLLNYRIRSSSVSHSQWTEQKMKDKLIIAQKLYELAQMTPKKSFPALHDFTNGYADYVIATAHDTGYTSSELLLLEEELRAFCKKSIFERVLNKIASFLKK